ncbi:MAG: rod shape-determining protein MreD [Elusimicrobiota bacterium]
MSLAAGVILHVLMQRYLSVNGVGINLLMLMTIEFSLIKSPEKGQVFGFFSGLIEDIVTAGLLGEKALLRTLAGFVSGKMKGKFSEGNFIFQLFMTFSLFFLYSYMTVVLRMVFSQPYSASAGPILIYSAVNALAAPFVYKVMHFIYAQ